MTPLLRLPIRLLVALLVAVLVTAARLGARVNASSLPASAWTEVAVKVILTSALVFGYLSLWASVLRFHNEGWRRLTILAGALPWLPFVAAIVLNAVGVYLTLPATWLPAIPLLSALALAAALTARWVRRGFAIEQRDVR
ncbi:MAG: hypothetical protein AAGF99_17300 [Bacteroidota bacterium]